MYDPAAKSAAYVSPESVPWPVLFMLGCRHKKHRYVSAALPRLQHIGEALLSATSRLKWRFHFAASSEDRPKPPRCLLYRKKITPFPSPSTSISLENFCNRLHSMFFEAATRSISKSRGRRKQCANVCPIDKAAHAWLLHSEYTAVPTDKQGGFCLVRVSDLASAQSDILAGPWYREVSANTLTPEYWKNSLVPAYRRIVKEIVDIDDRCTTSMLCGSLAGGLDKFCSVLTHTVKTHKDPGKVGFRPVHSSCNHAFTGVMAWLNLITGVAISKHKHVLHSSDDLIRDLNTFRPVQDMVFVHWDLKDFFMQGSTDFLVFHSSLVIPIKYRAVFRRALTFVLDNQYVRSRLIPNRLWKVVTGSGMGLKCSSNIADAAFLHAVELCGIGLAIRRSQERSGLIFYRRFRDNLLMVFHPNFVKIKSILCKLENSDPYTGEVEEASPGGVSYLDLNIHVDQKYHTVLYSPNVKPTALSSVLSIYSAHPSSVHGAWLKAYLLRLRKNSASIEWFHSFKDEIMRRLADNGVDRTVLSTLDRESQFTYPVPIRALRVRKPSLHAFRVVLPYHPMWYKSFGQTCADLSRMIRNLNEPGIESFQNVRIAWSLQSPCLANIVLKH